MVKSTLITLITFMALITFVSSYNFGETNFNFGEEVTTTTTGGITGDCPDGQFIQNITTGGVQCTTPAGGGDIEGVTAGTNLSGGGTSGTVTLNLNGTSVLTWLEGIFLKISNVVSLVGNWSQDKTNYYNTTNILDFGYYNSTTLPSTGSIPTLINLTSGTHDGSITNGTKTGYDAANSICNIQFPGSHFCDEFEVTQGFSNNASITINNSDAWCETGGPKYIPATVPVDSCGGWTYSGTTTHLGNYWHFDNVTGGVGRAINCGTELKLACCSY